jgi:hypothetical protein
MIFKLRPSPLPEAPQPAFHTGQMKSFDASSITSVTAEDVSAGRIEADRIDA